MYKLRQLYIVMKPYEKWLLRIWVYTIAKTFLRNPLVLYTHKIKTTIFKGIKVMIHQHEWAYIGTRLHAPFKCRHILLVTQTTKRICSIIPHHNICKMKMVSFLLQLPILLYFIDVSLFMWELRYHLSLCTQNQCW